MFTSTTAPGKSFPSRSDLADHYKSDWHKYNLKRREAGLQLLEETDFQARWEAALALRKEKEAKAHMGTDHLKNKTSKRNQQKQEKKQKDQQTAATATATKSETQSKSKAEAAAAAATKTAPVKATKQLPQDLVESQENPNIDPKQSLFDSHTSESLKENIDYMQDQFGFFIPDQECLVDLEGLLGYCHEKIKLGHYCLYCEKIFPTWQGCQKHMISKEHTKLRYETGYWDEVDPFYDFDRYNSKFSIPVDGNNDTQMSDAPFVDGDAMEDDGDNEGWEDVPEGDDENDQEMFDGYEKEIARFGLNVTPLGELVFPDGRIVGHRALNRYYKQNHRPANTNTAVVAAKRAAGERLYDGQVVNIGEPMPLDQLKGSGKGILVSLKDGVEGFSALSLYRFRAVVRKQRKDDDKGRRLEFRTTLNMNKMDKKANRMMNGVSVAHALR